MTTLRKLYQHQKDGVRWMLSCRNRFAGGIRLRGCIVADEMGLGKTLQALIAAKVHQQADPTVRVLVVCPKSLVGNWQREARLAGVHLDAVLSNHAASFPEGQPGKFVVIADEAHAFQDPKSQRTQRFLALCNGFKLVERSELGSDGKVVRRWKDKIVTGTEAQVVYLLTGTPIKNGRPHNLLPLLEAINHGAASPANRRNYLYRYCGPQTVQTPRGPVTTFNGATHLDELHQLCQSAILRRLTKECLDLPELTRTCRQAELTPEQERAYNSLLAQLKAEYQERLRKGQIKRGGEVLVLLGQLRQAGSHAKVATVIDLAEEVLEEGGQVVIFFDYVGPAQAVARHFGTEVFDGSTSLATRDRLVADFQAGKTKVFVGTGAGGEGVTLHAHGNCRTVILADRPWTPGGAVQREKRAHRIGQPNAVQAIWVQHGTVDEKVDAVLQEKAGNAEHVLAGTPTGGTGGITFSESDMADAVIDALGWND